MDQLAEYFKRYPSQRAVACKLMEYGLRVEKGVAYCGDIEMSDSGLARACGVDRRVVRTTLEHISSSPNLDRIFSKLKPMLSMVDMAEEIGCSSIVLIPTDSRVPGIIADVTTVLYNSGIVLRQLMVVDAVESDTSTLEIVVEGELPENVVMMLKSCRGVSGILL